MRDLIDRHPGRLLGLLNVALGASLLAGGPWRTSAYSFAVARELMPMTWWGLAFLIGGVCCLAAGRIRWWGVAALAVGAGVHAFWAGAVLAAALRDERGALTGVVVYSWLALLHILTGARVARRQVA